MDNERQFVILEGRVGFLRGDAEVWYLYIARRRDMPIILGEQPRVARMQREQVERSRLIDFNVLLA